MNLKKLGAVIGAAALLAAGAVVGIAAPASAHTGDLTASATCNTQTGQYDVTYTLKSANVPSNVSGTVKIHTGGSTFKSGWNQNSFTFEDGPHSIKPNGSYVWSATLPGNTKTGPWIYAVTRWTDGNTVLSDGQAEGLRGDCAVAPKQDAVASATVTAPTCTSTSTVTFALEHASWSSSQFSTTVGSHSRTATADNGHLFSNGKKSTTVSYTIQDKLKPSDCTPITYQTVVWQMPTKPADSNSATWPQTFVSATPEATETLDVPVPDTCGTYYQVDSYIDNATTQQLIALAKNGTKLTSPGTPPESLAPGGLNTAWKFVINADCKQVVVPQVTWTDNVCGNGTPNATLTLPDIEGVIWHVNNPNTVQAPGTYPMNAGGPNVVTATAAPGYVLSKPFEQDITFGPVKTNQSTNPSTNPDDCYVPPTIQACATPLPGILSTNLDANGWDFSDTRSAGHNTYVANGLQVSTDDDTSEAKAAGYHAVDIPLAAVGAPSISLDELTGGAPGLQLGIDRDGNGTWDGYLVNEGNIYGAGNWWTNKDGFGVPAGDGYPSLGTLQQYLAANPNAKIVSVGYSLGSGVKGSATIKSITVGCQTFTFDYKTQPGALATATPAAQATCHTPATESFTADHAVWQGEPVQNQDGSWSRTAVAQGDYVFPDGSTTLTLTYTVSPADTSLCAKPTLDGSVVTGKCIANAPWIFYDVTVTNPDHVALDGHDVTITMTGPKGDTWTQKLDTISTATEGDDATTDKIEVSGKVLWPGASVAADGVTPTGWPGWTQDASGNWVTTDGNYAWTRSVTSATLAVNPELSVAVSYPPATPSCNAAPPLGTDPTPTATSGLASTGSNIVFPLIAGGAIIVIGGAALAFALIRRRRTADEQ